MLNLSEEPALAAAVITEPQGTQAEIVAFYHAAMGSPTESTLIDAIRKNYVSLPGLTAELVAKFPPNSVATAKGHMDQFRQGHRSTQEEKETDSDIHPSVTPRRSSTATVFTKIVPLDDLRQTD